MESSEQSSSHDPGQSEDEDPTAALPSEPPSPVSETESAAEDDSRKAADFQSVIDTLPPVQSWSNTTLSTLKSAINERHPDAEWDEDSAWTEWTVDVILSVVEGWGRERLEHCSIADYFSLPTQTIALLNGLYHMNALDEVNARIEEGELVEALELFPKGRAGIGYPIFRVDYSDDELFELYKTCWGRFLEKEFYRPGAVSREAVVWHWVEDKSRLDGKGPHDVQQLFNSFSGNAFPADLRARWFCLMVDREAIQSMLRVYGEPAVLNFNVFDPDSTTMRVPFVPYVAAVGVNSPEGNDREGRSDEGREANDLDDKSYPGYFKVALESIFTFWGKEQIQYPDEYYTGADSIWADTSARFTAPKYRNGQ